MGRLNGKVAAITGGASGIGEATARVFVEEGARVAIADMDAERGRMVADEIKAAGGEVIFVEAHMEREADAINFIRRTVEQYGRLDILVNNAALFQPHPIVEVTEDEFDAAFALNAKGTFFVFQEAALRIGDGGRIINISSCSTAMSLPGFAVYVGSKAASEQFTKTLAKELGGRGITVNSVSPGFTETDMLPKDPEWRKMGAQMSALGRLGQAEDIADVVAFLTSEQGKWITGHNIQACGGVVM